MTAMRLMDGSEAIVEAAIMAGLRFYAGYPMAPLVLGIGNVAVGAIVVAKVTSKAESINLDA